MIDDDSIKFLTILSQILSQLVCFCCSFFHLNSVKVKAKAKVKLSQSCVIN